MIEDLNLDPLPGLPDDLAELDAELRDIRMAERPSFGPELHAELERAWREHPTPEGSAGGTRRALAASIGAVLFAGMLVPPARAAIAELSRQSLRLLGVTDLEVSATVPRSGPALPFTPSFAVAPVTGSAEDPPEPPPARATTVDSGATRAPVAAVEKPPEMPRFEDVEITEPVLVDQRADEEAIRKYYPAALEEQGIGGTVMVRGWVDSTGVLRNVSVTVSSGYARMDRAAEQAARELRYHPARFGDRAVGTLVEFPMAFVPLSAARSLPTVTPMERPGVPEGLDTDFASLWPDEAVVPAPYQVEAQQLLRAAMGRPADLEARFGSVDNLLAGEPPADVYPTRWRTSATAALEQARLRDPDNPAPYIALGRIHKRMGLRADALALFQKGIERTSRGAVSPRLVAELNYERGMLLKDAWLSVRDLGRISPEEAADVRCVAGRTGGTLVDRLIGLNYLCYDEVARLLEERFEPVRPGDAPKERMLEAFRAAVAVYPAHVGANVELLLDRADEGRWFDMLNDARSFAWASRGDPHALLLSGMALQRLGRPDEAMEDFALALRSLPDDEGRLLEDISPLLSDADRRELAQLSAEALEARTAAFWSGLDPLRLTDVNERKVEHLARATYALLRLGGTDTDAGEVWIRYGPPLTIRSLGEGTPLRTEFWSFERGPALTFQRPSTSQDLRLTPEAKAYLNDMSPLLPHRYGRQGRRVTDLDAQVGRFRALGGDPAEVTVDARIPEALVTEAADSILAGLFVLGADGTVLSEQRRTLPAVEGEVRMDAPVPHRADRVVMELYNPSAGQAAAERSPVVRERAEGEDPRISDLLVTEPATPLTRDFRRGDSWLIPRPDHRDARGPKVGLLFEIYGLEIGSDPYRLCVEVEPEEGEGIVTLPIRPAGEEGFGMEWPRTPLDGPEFVTLDLSDVGPGRYTLRLLVDRPGHQPIVAERTIER